jgi:hypothetical protein
VIRFPLASAMPMSCADDGNEAPALAKPCQS